MLESRSWKIHCYSLAKTLLRGTVYLKKVYGMMMIARNIVMFRMPIIVAWWIQFLKN
jgi:hypothetical protein